MPRASSFESQCFFSKRRHKNVCRVHLPGTFLGSRSLPHGGQNFPLGPITNLLPEPIMGCITLGCKGVYGGTLLERYIIGAFAPPPLCIRRVAHQPLGRAQPFSVHTAAASWRATGLSHDHSWVARQVLRTSGLNRGWGGSVSYHLTSKVTAW